MALVKCPDCGKMVSERASGCPECGCPSEFFERKINMKEMREDAIEGKDLFNGKQKFSNEITAQSENDFLDNQVFVRGQVFDICEGNGRIKVPKRKELVCFSESSLVGVTIQELKKGDFVDYLEIRGNNGIVAHKIRKTSVEWLRGVLTEINDNYIYIRYENESKNRSFWFKEEDVCLGESVSDFKVNDSVLFQCGGFFDSSNHVNMVSKKVLGYITYLDISKSTGVIDFRYKFTTACVNNLLDVDGDISFYLVSYRFQGTSTDLIEDITIIRKTKEIIFDGFGEWIDGSILKKEVSKNGNRFAVISSPELKSKNKFKFNVDDMDTGCRFEDIAEEQRVSFQVDEMACPKRVAWGGYITRFPVYPDVVDMSGRIDTELVKGGVECNKSSLLYFRKYKIHELKHNEDFTRYWIEANICGDRKIVPIKTVNSNIRYKVKFAYADDEVYERKAVRIHIIGINKCVFEDEVGVRRDKAQIVGDEDSAQLIVNNYYYGDNYNNSIINNLKILQINSVDDFLQLINENDFETYIESVYKQIASDCSDCNSKPIVLDDAKANEIADRIFPRDVKLTKENVNQLEEKFNEARDIHPEVSDALLDNLSENCRLYVKIAIIVEYTLQHLTQLSVNDNSAQMVMYGKALEQGLRDCLYDFIVNDEELRNFVDKKGYSFSKINCDKANIGNFTSIIWNKAERFSQVCSELQNSIEIETKSYEEWVEWWKILCENTNAARELRNNSDHAGTEVELSAIGQMSSLLFDEEGIFNQLILVDSMYANGQTRKMFIGIEMQGKHLIVGRLSSGEKAALHITEVKKSYTSAEEFQKIFEQSREGILVKIKRTDKGISASLK